MVEGEVGDVVVPVRLEDLKPSELGDRIIGRKGLTRMRKTSWRDQNSSAKKTREIAGE